MTRSKKIFAGFAMVFALAMAYVVYDISGRTTFPGSRAQKKDLPEKVAPDSVRLDSTGR